VTIQAQILKLLRQLQKEFDISAILITHNLGVVAQTCDRLVILYAGRVVEIGTTRQIFKTPNTPIRVAYWHLYPGPVTAAKRWPSSRVWCHPTLVRYLVARLPHAAST